MKIVLASIGPKTAVDVLAVLVFEDSVSGDEVVAEIDTALGGALRAAMTSEEFTAKKDSQLVLATLGKLPARKIALIGLGPSGKSTAADVRVGSARAARLGNGERATTLAIVLPKAADPIAVRYASEGALLGAYRFTKYMTGDRVPKQSIATTTIGLRAPANNRAFKITKPQEAAVVAGTAVGNAVNLVRDLVNEPPNELTPAALAKVAQDVAKKHKLDIKVLDRKGIIGAGMKLLEAVGRGSVNEPRFVHMTYAPPASKRRRKRVVIVGKGLTFDSGGLCIKPAPGMGDMKCDMAGAAVSIGAMAAVAALGLNVEVHGIFAAAENMPDGAAYRPGDIFGSLDGKSVEIINTDAEGRLVLADALSYANKLEPDVLIDHATLTGAIMVALGAQCAGLYSNDDELAHRYLESARSAGESMWHMPLLEELREGLKSDVADLKHTGERYGGSITGALFLREFVNDKKWIHVDIAGPAFTDRQTSLSSKGGTGFGLLAFIRFLEDLR